MTVLDAQAVIAFLTGEPAASEVATILRSADGSSIGAADVAEVVDVLVRLHGHGSDAVLEKLDWIVAAGLSVEPLDDAAARRAGALRAQHYDRAENPLSLADCMALAVALDRDEPLATADPPLARTAALLGVLVVALPDSRGRRPEA